MKNVMEELIKTGKINSHNILKIMITMYKIRSNYNNEYIWVNVTKKFNN